MIEITNEVKEEAERTGFLPSSSKNPTQKTTSRAPAAKAPETAPETEKQDTPEQKK